jgi:hypothetical protein
MTPSSLQRPRWWSRPLGFGLGLGIIAVVLAASSVPAGNGEARAHLTMAAQTSGELTFSKQGPFLSTADLTPRRPTPASGTLSVRNQTGARLAVRLRALPSLPDLDDMLEVTVTAGGQPVFGGRLKALRGWTPRSFALDAGRSVPLEVRAWLPRDSADGYQGRVVDAPIEFRARPETS